MKALLKFLLPLTLAAFALVAGFQAALAQDEHEHMHVNIDIKPGSYPNAINLRSNGVIPAALFGGEDFNVYDVDLASVRLGQMHQHEAGAPVVQFAYEDANGDGYTDLLLKFRTQETGLQPEDTMACLHGMLMDGAHFCGHDSVKIIY